ncbi:FAD-binding protein [Rhodococcus sp. WS4]|nr:FAD-binding protein [Rhodococcus sp. WS4]
MLPRQDGGALPGVFSPIRVGSMSLRNRIMLPPHAQITGAPFGTEEQAAPFFAHIGARARDGVGWVDSLNCLIANSIVIPGFEPQGRGATVTGWPRLPVFRERLGRFAQTCHDAGAAATCQLSMMGAMPHSASGLVKKVDGIQRVPHAMTLREIGWMIDEYAFSAGEIAASGLDGLEIHANNEDVLQLFMSPATNRRDDKYGGSFDNRIRLAIEVLEAVRSAVGSEFTVGVRMSMREFILGGYDVESGIEMAKCLEATGLIDYFHGVAGTSWGNPSYNAPHILPPGAWAKVAGRYRAALSLPVVYSGRIDDLRRAEEIISAGMADVIGVGRAMFADGEILSKSHSGRFDDVRPCVGTNDCLHRVIVEGLSFGCSVNPRAGYEHRVAHPPAEVPKKVLVVGGGPAGMEVAAGLAERGHETTLWEKDTELGGQLRAAATIAENSAFTRYIAWQSRRLEKVGVDVHLGVHATRDNILSEPPDVVVVATGASGMLPDIPGADLPFVSEARDVLLGHRVVTGDRVIVVALEDHMQPLTVARFLADRGKELLILNPTTSVAQLVGSYSLGGPLGKLSDSGARFQMMEQVVEIAPGEVTTVNVYSGKRTTYQDFDEVVFSTSGKAESLLYDGLEGVVDEIHIVGDAYAPRRLSFATRQAYALAGLI